MSLQPDDMNHHHILAKPMFEVFGISIHTREIKDRTYPNSVCDGNPCKIHGMVQVVDEDDKKIDLYNRKENNHEIINFGDFLSLTGFPIIPYKALKVAINLYDMAHNAEIANGTFIVDYRTQYDYDKVHVEKVEGKYGFAYVYHATFQHAVMATVEQVVFQKEVGGSRFDADLFGSVVARLERSCGNSNGDVDPSFILFDNQQNLKESKSVQAKFNTPIKPFRSCVAVPVYCCLRIKADFCDNTGNKIFEDIKLDVSNEGLIKKSVSEQNCEMRVEVKWCHGYMKFSQDTKVKDNIDAEEEFTLGIEATGIQLLQPKSQGSSDVEQPLSLCAEAARVDIEEDNTKVLTEAKQSSSSISSRRPCAAIPIFFPCVEVFSVLICVDDNDVDICGTIEVIDSSSRPFYIFNGLERCCDRKTLSIVGPPSSFDNEPFFMRTNLKDRKGRVISMGSFGWNLSNDDGVMSFHDRFICSVIQGDIGYAAIHYSMITYGVQARISVMFLSNVEGFLNVYGRITAEYANYQYANSYDQEYYKSTIFSKIQGDCVRVDMRAIGATLPLSKSVISMPVEDSLILDVNLTIIGSCKNLGHVVVKELVEFKTNVQSDFHIRGFNYGISICVEELSVVRDRKA